MHTLPKKKLNKATPLPTILNIKPRNKLRFPPSGKSKAVRLVSAKQEINEVNEKEREKKSTTNKPEKNKNKSDYIYKSKQQQKAK